MKRDSLPFRAGREHLDRELLEFQDRRAPGRGPVALGKRGQRLGVLRRKGQPRIDERAHLAVVERREGERLDARMDRVGERVGPRRREDEARPRRRLSRSFINMPVGSSPSGCWSTSPRKSCRPRTATRLPRDRVEVLHAERRRMLVCSGLGGAARRRRDRPSRFAAVVRLGGRGKYQWTSGCGAEDAPACRAAPARLRVALAEEPRERAGRLLADPRRAVEQERRPSLSRERGLERPHDRRVADELDPLVGGVRPRPCRAPLPRRHRRLSHPIGSTARPPCRISKWS